MPITGPDGVLHILSTDVPTEESRRHLLNCQQCQAFYPIVYQEVKYMDQYSETPQLSNGREPTPRYIEDDLKVLKDIDARIAELIAERHDRMDTIKAQHESNLARINSHADWFEGNVRGNPVPDRGMNDMPGPSMYPR